MKKQPPNKNDSLFEGLDAPEPHQAGTVCNFEGTDNPREIRVLQALIQNPSGIKRERLDRVARCSNGPELAASLRRKGFGTNTEKTHLYCVRVPENDFDNRPVKVGRYVLTPAGRRAVFAFFAKSKIPIKGEGA
jgi:hypothetical protein